MKPKPVKNVDVSELQAKVLEYIDYVDSDDWHEDDDRDVYIFECALETFFGKDVWKWINNRHE